jgi:hypothetical protein
MAMPPTMGGSGKVLVFSAETWIEPRSRPFSYVAELIACQENATSFKAMRMTAIIVHIFLSSLSALNVIEYGFKRNCSLHV